MKFRIFDNCYLQIFTKEFNYIVYYIEYTFFLKYLRMVLHNFDEKYIMNNQPCFIMKSYALVIFEYICNAYSPMYGYYHLLSVILNIIWDICVLDLYLKEFIYITYFNDFINLQVMIRSLFSYYFYRMIFSAIKFRLFDIYVSPLFIIEFNYISHYMEYTVLVISNMVLHNFDEKYKLCFIMISCFFIYKTSFKLFTSIHLYYVCRKFVSFHEIMQKHFFYLNILLLWWSHIFIFMPKLWFFTVFETFYCDYPDHICTKYSIFYYAR